MGAPFERAVAACCGALALLFVAGLSALAAPAVPTAQGSVLEYQAKALVLLRIAQFTDWPANIVRAPAPFVVGVLGSDPFGEVLDHAVEGITIAGRPVVVQRFDEPERLGRVDLLFVSASHRHAVGRTLARLGSAPTLTVADFETFLDRGGAVELFLDEGRVRFRVDRRAAEAVGLGLRSQLLRAAAVVQ